MRHQRQHMLCRQQQQRSQNPNPNPRQVRKEWATQQASPGVQRGGRQAVGHMVCCCSKQARWWCSPSPQGAWQAGSFWAVGNPVQGIPCSSVLAGAMCGGGMLLAAHLRRPLPLLGPAE